MIPLSITIEVERVDIENDDSAAIQVEVQGEVTVGTPDGYFHPGDPDEVQIMTCAVCESEHPKYAVGATIELTPEEYQKAQDMLLAKAKEPQDWGD